MKNGDAQARRLISVPAAGAELGRLAMSVHCAGGGIAARTVGRDGTPHDLDAFRRTVELNLIGTFNVLRLVAAAMVGQDPTGSGERGVCINTASIAAFDGQIGQIAYSASKGGVVGMTLPAARDLAPVGIRVLTIAPGTFDTPLLGLLPDDQRQALAKDIPFPKRLGRPVALVRRQARGRRVWRGRRRRLVRIGWGVVRRRNVGCRWGRCRRGPGR